MSGVDELLGPLGEVIRTRRRDAGFSARTLANRGQISTRFLSELEAGRANISVRRLSDVARAFGTTASALLLEAENAINGRPRPIPRVVSLLGIRGAGKSAIGPVLATRLGVPFVELDRLIEDEAGLSVGEVFALHGERYYRRLELAALSRFLAGEQPAVLATGGGIVQNDEAFEMLRRRTVTVWLAASATQLWNRVVRQGDSRPMAGIPAARAELRRLVAEREPLYRRAEIRIDTSRLGVSGSVKALVQRLRAEPSGAGPRRSARPSA